MLTAAIGDIHGCLNELIELVRLVQQKHEIGKWIFIGDYIDRGPDSKGVIDFIKDFHLNPKCNAGVYALRGNHEEMLLDTYKHLLDLSWWFGNGGEATVKSFGNINARHIPQEYIEWMDSRLYYHDDGKRFFVHAGVNQKPPEKTPKEDMLWIRDSFLKGNKSWGRYIVHGHTPYMDKMISKTPYRLNLDSGCVYGGHLTCAIFNDEQVEAIDYIHVKPIKFS